MIPTAPAFNHMESDGTRLVVMTDVDSVNIYHGGKVISSFSLTAMTAARLAWFLLWVYWVRWLGMGWRTWRQHRSLRKRLKQQALRA